MADPDRLLSRKAGTDPEVRELLESLRKVAPPARAGVESWGAMAAQLPSVGLGKPALLQSTRWGASKALLVKAALVLSTVGAGVVAWQAWGARATTVNRVAPIASPAAGFASQPSADGSRSVPQASSAEAAPSTPESVPPQSALQKTPPHGPGQSQLDAEVALLTEARAELGQGQVSAAQGTLRRLQTAFPKGILTQERDVLEIEILNAIGQRATAQQKARAFIAAHPGSPHSAKLQRFLENP